MQETAGKIFTLYDNDIFSIASNAGPVYPFVLVF